MDSQNCIRESKMKYENISIRFLRERKWSQVDLLVKDRPHAVSNLRADLHFYKSRGRYNYIEKLVCGKDTKKNVLEIWFELPEDATYFSLKYAA